MHEHYDVCLVEVPFSSLAMPVFSLSILKGSLNEASISSKIIYGNLFLADLMGLEEYLGSIGTAVQSMVMGEAIFAEAAYGVSGLFDRYQDFLYEYKPHYPMFVLDGLNKSGRGLYELIEEFLEKLSEKILKHSPKIVAMSALFFQTNACLALSRILKKKDPDIVVIMGGGNCILEAGKAILDYNPTIDYTFSGEADECFSEWCRLILEYGKNIPPQKLPYGVISRDKDFSNGLPLRVTANLDTIPYPDYSDYFEQIEEYDFAKDAKFAIMSEFSRGCWWHSKKGCTFCGLNPYGDKYRIKSKERILEELLYFKEKYSGYNIVLTDNSLSPLHIKELPEKIEALKLGVSFFAEVKSNISREDLKRLKKAGFFAVQPGIESLEDEILLEMNKGARAIKQIEFLRNAFIVGIVPIWHILGGFPFEKEESYERLYDTLKSVTHLQSARQFTHIIYCKYSEYYNNPEKYGLKLVAEKSYRYVFPLGDDYVDRLAFMYRPTDEKMASYYWGIGKKGEAYQKVKELHGYWVEQIGTKKDVLKYKDNKDSLEITDLRKYSQRFLFTLDALNRDLCLGADSVIKEEELINSLKDKYEEEKLREALFELIKKRLIIKMKDEVLFLAVDESVRVYSEKDFEEMPIGRFGKILL